MMYDTFSIFLYVCFIVLSPSMEYQSLLTVSIITLYEFQKPTHIIMVVHKLMFTAHYALCCVTDSKMLSSMLGLIKNEHTIFVCHS